MYSTTLYARLQTFYILRTDNKLINPKITSLFTQSGK